MRLNRESHNHITQAEDVVDLANNVGDGCEACTLIRPDSQDRGNGPAFRWWTVEQLESFFGPLPQPINRDATDGTHEPAG